MRRQDIRCNKYFSSQVTGCHFLSCGMLKQKDFQEEE
jgi:hypothetical protein